MSDRRCQSCMMIKDGWRLDYYDKGSETRRDFYYAKYSKPDGKRVYLWHSQFCSQCFYDGNVISRMTFSTQKVDIDISAKKESNSSHC